MNNITQISADISWIAGGSENEFLRELNSSSQSMTGLSSATQYDEY